MSQATYIRDMVDELEPQVCAGSSEIASFYAGRNVLLTGGTGFLGRLLTERILRSCPNVATLFLLVRAKKGKSPKERLEELFNDVIFDRLRREKPAFARKVVLIEGDMMQIGLGLSIEQRELLRSTEIVIHGAATVRFDEKLRIAANINVRGTEELISLAKEMVNLKVFIYISTAYSNCVSKKIEEKCYPPPINSDKLLSLLDILDDAYLDHLTPVLLGKWPNTYAFTKAVAEDIVHRNCQSLPLCIVRPSIVVATWKEPVAGWINNFYGAAGVVAGVAIGLLRTLHCDHKLVADLIPADYVVNNIIAAAWDVAKTQGKKMTSANSSFVPKVAEPSIYNIVSSPQNPITWGQYTKYSTEHGTRLASMACLWYRCFRLNKYRWVNNLYVIFLHLIPAAIVDSLAWLTGRKPMLWNAYKKIHKFSSVIEYFTLQEWQFDNHNVQRLWESLGPADRSEFDLDIARLDWDDYSLYQMRGCRVYIFNDPMDTVPQGRAKYAKLRAAHYTLVTAVCGFMIWLLWILLRFICELW